MPHLPADWPGRDVLDELHLEYGEPRCRDTGATVLHQHGEGCERIPDGLRRRRMLHHRSIVEWQQLRDRGYNRH